MRRVPVLCAVLSLAVPAAGCGGRTPSDEEQVRDVLSTFARAAEKRDYQTICDDVFAPALLTGLQEIGLPCEVAMRNSLGSVKSPRLTVGEVKVSREKATAQVRTSAENQPPSSDTLELVRVAGKWRVSALSAEEQATPAPTAKPKTGRKATAKSKRKAKRKAGAKR